MANKDTTKTLCAIDFIKGTDIGGPTINNNRIIQSKLNEYICLLYTSPSPRDS